VTEDRSGVERPLSYQEKRALGQDIHKLPADKVHTVIDIIKTNGCQVGLYAIL